MLRFIVAALSPLDRHYGPLTNSAASIRLIGSRRAYGDLCLNWFAGFDPGDRLENFLGFIQHPPSALVKAFMIA